MANYSSPDALAQEAGKLDYGALPSTSRLRGPCHLFIPQIPVIATVINDALNEVIDLGEVPPYSRIIPHLCTASLPFITPEEGATVAATLELFNPATSDSTTIAVFNYDETSDGFNVVGTWTYGRSMIASVPNSFTHHRVRLTIISSGDVTELAAYGGAEAHAVIAYQPN